MKTQGRHIVSLFFVTFLSLLFLNGCVPNHYNEIVEPVSLLKQSAGQIKTASVVVGLDPNNTTNFVANQQVNASNQQGGLIGMLVATALTSSMNDELQRKASLISPIRNAAINFNFGSAYRQALASNMKTLPWFKLSHVNKAPSFQRHQPLALQHDYKDDAIIVSDVFYKMADDFSKMTFTSYVTIFPNNDALKQLVKKAQPGREHGVLYQKMYTSEFTAPAASSNETANAEMWANDNAALVHKALKQGIKTLSTQIINDLKIL